MKKEITVYITKYWETKGIIATKATITHGGLCKPVKESGLNLLFFDSTYWHTDRGEAIEHVEARRKKKLLMLEAKIKKLMRMQIK